MLICKSFSGKSHILLIIFVILLQIRLNELYIYTICYGTFNEDLWANYISQAVCCMFNIDSLILFGYYLLFGF